MLVTATVTLDPQETVFKQAALQVILKLLADKIRQVTTRSFDLLYETGVMFGNN